MSAPAEHARQHYNITLAALTAAGIAFALQQTLVIPALPAFQRDLHTSTAWATWLLTAFLLSASVLTPLLGKLGDQYGKERLLVISLGIFLLGSIGAIFAWNIGSLIVCRVIQGAGGAVFPLSFAIIKDEFPRERMGTAIGIVSSVFAIGGSIGLVLSGVIVDYASWRWLFVIGAIGVAVADRARAPVRARVADQDAVARRHPRRAAPLGHAHLPAAGADRRRELGLGVRPHRLRAARRRRSSWPSPGGLVELRVPEPMVDMRMLAHRPVLLTNLIAMVERLRDARLVRPHPELRPGAGDLPASVARLVDYGFGVSASKTGLYLLPGALMGLVGGPLAGKLGQALRLEATRSPAGMAITGVGIAYIAVAHDHAWQIVLGNVALGFGIVLAFAAMATIIVSSVRPTETGVATGMNTVMRTIGGVIGGQVGAAILTAQTIPDTSVPAESAFVWAFGISAMAAFGGAVLAVFVTPRRAPSPRSVAVEAAD